jgi:MFS family permease
VAPDLDLSTDPGLDASLDPGLDPSLSPDSTPAPSPPPLNRNWNFQTLWIGSAFGILGLEVADIGYPLVVLGITGSPGKAGLFAVVQLVCTLITGLPAGALVDTFDRRLVLILGESVRVVATTGVAVALATDRLTYSQLLITAGVLGLVQPLSGTARMVLIRSVVAPEQLTTALTRDEVRVASGALAGPPIGGVLFSLSRLAPFVFTAAAFLLSLLCALFLRLPPKPAKAPKAPAGKKALAAAGPEAGPDADPEAGQAPAAAAEESPFAQMSLGIRSLWADPVLRTTTALVAAINTIGAPLALMAVVILQGQGVGSWQIGIAMSGVAVGGLIGAPLVGPLHRILRPGTLLLGVSAIVVVVLALLAPSFGPWWLMGVLLVGSIGLPALRVLVDVLIFRQVPDEQRGRVIASVMTLLGLGAPLGTGLASLLLEYLTPAHSMLALSAVLAVFVLLAFGQRGLRSAEWPEEKDH